MHDSEAFALQGWRVITGCSLPGSAPCHLAAVALHQRHGIALVDRTRDITPYATERLVARLRRAGFATVYSEAWPPVRHLALTEGELTDPVPLLEDAFRDLPAPELPGGDAWVDTAERALLREAPRSEPLYVAATYTADDIPPPEPKPDPEVAPSPRWRKPALAAALLAVAAGSWAVWPKATPPSSPAPLAAVLPATAIPAEETVAPPALPAAPTPTPAAASAPALTATPATLPLPLPLPSPPPLQQQRPVAAQPVVSLTSARLPVGKPVAARADRHCQQARAGRPAADHRSTTNCRVSH